MKRRFLCDAHHRSSPGPSVLGSNTERTVLLFILQQPSGRVRDRDLVFQGWGIDRRFIALDFTGVSRQFGTRPLARPLGWLAAFAAPRATTGACYNLQFGN